jgi:hypothetical protein
LRKIIIAIFLIMIILIMAVSCTTAEYNTQADRSKVVAKVNDQALYKAELNDRWSTVLPMMEATFATMTDKEIEQKELSTKLEILDSMISQEINRQKADSDEYNISLTQEELISLDLRFNEVILSMEAYILQNFNKSGITEVTSQQMTAELKAFFAGQGTTREDYYEDMKIIEMRKKLRIVIGTQITSVSKQETKMFYEKMLDEQQTLYTENPGRFEADMRDGDLVLNILDGYKIFKKIFIPYQAKDDELIQLMVSSKLEQETIGAIEMAYANLDKQVNEVYDALENETKTFDELMIEYNPTTAEKIYFISQQTKSYTDDTKNAALAIKSAGQYSKAVPQTNGVIIWMLTDVVENAGVVPLEKVYEQIEALALQEKRDLLWEQKQASWLEESKIKIYKNRIK